jgi:hypothetical protein
MTISALAAAYGGRVTIPRPINMWRNQRALRRSRENLRECIASGSFTYRAYEAQISEDHTQWTFGLIGKGRWRSADTAEECMSRIDEICKDD